MNKKFNIQIVPMYSEELCDNNPNKLYIFGDNTKRIGLGGQASIRNKSNSVGICTKKSIFEFMTDDEFEQNKIIIDSDIKTINDLMEQGEFNILVFPESGLGWGRALMQKYCPKTALYLSTRLLEEYNFNNLESLVNKNEF